MRRRKFLGLTFGTAAVWPMAGYAQQALPVVGFLSGRSAAESEYVVAALAEGLRERLKLGRPLRVGAGLGRGADHRDGTERSSGLEACPRGLGGAGQAEPQPRTGRDRRGDPGCPPTRHRPRAYRPDRAAAVIRPEVGRMARQT